MTIARVRMLPRMSVEVDAQLRHLRQLGDHVALKLLLQAFAEQGALESARRDERMGIGRTRQGEAGLEVR
jgi:hypothetical protein